MQDLQLTRNFRLSEWPCWTRMTPEQVEGALEAAVNHLQPLRDVFGPIVVTSGNYWRAGCIPRTGDHAQPGTVDYFPLEAPLLDVFTYARTQLPRSFGVLIHELYTAPHLHRTPWGLRNKFGAAYMEPSEGKYELVTDAARAVAARPFRGDRDGGGPLPGAE